MWVMALIVAFAFPVFAADRIWTTEVNNLRGIQLGSDFFSSYKECPKRVNVRYGNEYWPEYDKDYPAEFKDIPCYKVISDPVVIDGSKVFRVDNLVFIKGAGRSVQVTLLDDHVESIEVEFLNSYREQFYAAMLEKYGRPSVERVEVFQNGYGQSFSGRSLIWKGRSVVLTYDEHRPGGREWGAVVMMSKKFEERIDEAFKMKKDSVKNGF